jgi:FkbM family methyltransferase
MTMISHAQNFEDVMIWRALKSVEQGFYLDIGAHSPDQWSVTKLFHDKGWRGLNIEPHPVFLQQLMEKRPNDTNLGFAVSDFQGEADFFCVENTGLSSLNITAADSATRRGFSKDTIQVPVRTLSAIWDDFVPPDQPVHFLKIDVEGHEEQVVRGGDWARHRPWIVIVEATKPNSTTLNHHCWDPMLQEFGYDFVWFDGLNRFYLAHEHAGLKDAFKTPPNVFDNFRKAEEAALEMRAITAEAKIFKVERMAIKMADLTETLTELSDRVTEQKNRISELIESTERRDKPLWNRLFFRQSGKPKKAVRRALFHTSGKPRGVFRKWVLHPDGQPRAAFRKWMSSPEYQILPRAVRVASPTASTVDALSRDGERAFLRLAAVRRSVS